MTPSVEALVVAGTRPEFIKLAPVVRRLDADRRFEPTLVHTGQHYDDELSGSFFRALELPEPDHHLSVGSGTHEEQTAEMLTGVGRILAEREPPVTIAQGDTNSTLSAALAASKRPTLFAHVEAGLRSGDRSMPEETNRVLADHVSEALYAPTEEAATNLAREGIDDAEIVGNTVVDACLDHREAAARESDVLERFGLTTDDYVAATIHRPRNTDDPERLRAILSALDGADTPVVFPAHPRTTAAIDDIGFEPEASLHLADPFEYLDFLRLLDAAALAVTDSGGIQEEASILETPCLTVRPNTERPETVEAGVNELVEPVDLSARLDALLADADARAAMTGATELYGDGNAADRIVESLADAAETEE